MTKTERIFCVMSDWRLIVHHGDGTAEDIQLIGGGILMRAYADDYEARGYRRVQPDYFNRREWRRALQGSE